MTSSDSLLTVKEVAALLKISLSSAYSLAGSGQLTTLRIGKSGGSLRIRASEVQRYLTACESKAFGNVELTHSHSIKNRPMLKHLKV